LYIYVQDNKTFFICQENFGSFKNLVGKKLRLECDINLKPLKNLCTQDFNKVIG
jgi:hypothetical protein